METKINHPLQKYFRGPINYTTRPGCGNGIISQAILWAIEELAMDFNKFAFVSGIGCSGWIPSPSYNTDVLHVTHGRAIAFATGLKLATPDMKVIVTAGDGDTSAIGGNHFIHACRRNIDLTAIVMNNNIYGMTGGQASPTTPGGAKATTAPYGVMDPSFDICRLAEGAGATFIARTTIANPVQCEKFIQDGIEHKGFSVIEIVSSCHTQFGRRNSCRTPIENIKRLKDASIPANKTKDMSPDELADKIVIGEFVNKKAPEYTEQYLSLIDRVKGD